MKKILVTYATMAGSTADVAEAIAKELTQGGFQVEVLPVSKVNGLASYNAVVVGGPMIMGWHREATRFLKQNRTDLQHIPVAIFVLAMSLTQTKESSVDGVEVYIDETLPKPPIKPDKLSFRENYARLPNYVRPILRSMRPIKPVSMGIFYGRLEYGRLKWWAVLFAMLIIRATAGDRRNWPSIQQWATQLGVALNRESQGGGS